MLVDYPGLYQEPRSESQETIFAKALTNVGLWFSHELITVYLLTDMDPSEAAPAAEAFGADNGASKKKLKGGLSQKGTLVAHAAAAEGSSNRIFSDNSSKHVGDIVRAERGWPYFEEALSRGLKKILRPKALSDLQLRQRRYVLPGVEEPAYFWSKVVDLSVDPLATVSEVPPIPPSMLEAELEWRRFLEPSDRSILAQVYKTSLNDALQGTTSMSYREAGFTDEELTALAKTLSETQSTSCTSLDLSCNSISPKGVEALVNTSCASWLSQLALSLCPRLVTLPDTFGTLLPKLTLLDLTHCRKLRELPDTIGELSLLEVMSLRGCTCLNKVPDTVGRLSHLTTLDIRQCAGLIELPASLSQLVGLKQLPLDGCDEIIALPDLSHVKGLEVGKLPPRIVAWDTGGRVPFDFRRSGRRRGITMPQGA